MATTEELLIQIKANASQMKKELGAASSSLKSMKKSGEQAGGSLDKLKGLAGTFGLAIGAAGAAKAVFDFSKESVKAFAELENFRGALEASLPAGASYVEFMDKARIATSNTMSELELAQAGTTLFAGGLAGTTDEASKLIAAGSTLTGVFAANGASMEKFVRLLASGNKVLLDNFGLTAEQVKAIQKQIEATEGLSGEEAKLAAVREAVIQQAEKFATSMGDTTKASLELSAATEDLKATFGESLAPSVSATQTQLAGLLRGIVDAKKAADEYDESLLANVESYDEYIKKSGAILGKVTLTRSEFNALRETTEEATEATGEFAHENIKLGITVLDTSAAVEAQEKAMEEEQKAADALEKAIQKDTQALVDMRIAQEETAEAAREMANEMMIAQAEVFLDLKSLREDAVESEQEFNDTLASIRGDASERQASEQQELADRLATISSDREEKIQEILAKSGDQTQEKTDEQLAKWNQHFAKLEAETRTGYTEQNTAINEALVEREASLQAAREKELAQQKEALEKLKLQAALTILETQGLLEEFTGGIATSASDAAALIEAGILPVSVDMAKALGDITKDLTKTSEEAAKQAEKNAELIGNALAGTLEGEAQPAIEDTGTAFGNFGDTLTQKSEQEITPAIQETDQAFLDMSNITLPDLDRTTRDTATSAVSSVGRMEEKVDELAMAVEAVDMMSIAEEAEAAANAISSSFEAAGDSIEDTLIPVLNQLVIDLDEVGAAANSAAGAVSSVGAAPAGGGGGGGGGVGMQEGGSLIVPQRFRRGLPIIVHPGEEVNVTAAKNVGRGTGNTFILNIFPSESQIPNVIQGFRELQAMSGVGS